MSFYLENLNPLRGLSEWTLVALLDNAQLGDYARLMWTYYFIEKRNPYARAVKRRLLSAIGKLTWDIKEIESDDPSIQAQAKAQGDALRAAYDKIDNLQEALNFLALAELRGYSHLEKIFDAEGQVVELRIREQWFWSKDGWYGDWKYNVEARDGRNQGVPVDPAQIIVRTVDDPVDEIMARAHVRMEVADGDWEEYLRDYGLPNIIVEMPPNIPPEKEAQYQAMAEKITGGARGAVPSGSKVNSVESQGGDDAFKKRIDFLAELIAIAGTGGKLNILTESGTGTMGAGAVKDAFDDLADSIAGEISGTMQEQFDQPLLADAFPGQPALAYFEFASADEEDKGKVLLDAKTAYDAGYEIDAADLSERTGYKLKKVESGNGKVEIPAVAAKPPEKLSTTDPQPSTFFEDAVASVLHVSSQIVSPAASVFNQLDALAANAALTDSQLADAAQKIIDQLPDIARESDLQPIIDALTQAMTEAANTGTAPSDG